MEVRIEVSEVSPEGFYVWAGPSLNLPAVNGGVVHDRGREAAPRRPEAFAASVRGPEVYLEFKRHEYPVGGRDVVAEDTPEDVSRHRSVAVADVDGVDKIAGSESAGLVLHVGIPEDLGDSARLWVKEASVHEGVDDLVLHGVDVSRPVAVLVDGNLGL